MKDLIIALINDVALPIVVRVLKDNPNATDDDVKAALAADVQFGVAMDDAFLALKEQIKTGQS